MAEQVRVAKFGGTSMAQPERVNMLVAHPDIDPHTVVVSAPGVDDSYPEKMTGMLFRYAEDPSRETARLIQQRYAHIADRLGNQAVYNVVDAIPDDLDQWNEDGNPVPALGEYWSARLMAAYSDREFVDARELIYFDASGAINRRNTRLAIERRLSADGKYVVPGYYGMGHDGHARLFERGGSDISGAIVAKVLNAESYQNWSDVDGFFSADPRLVPTAQRVHELTYREARELGNGGTGLLHREAIRILSGSGIPTHMHNTFGESIEPGTIIGDTRDWTRSPATGVTGIDDMVSMSVYRQGMDQMVGGTSRVYTLLRKQGIPYEHTATATDNIAVYLKGEHRSKLDDIAEQLRTDGNRILIKDVSMIHVVGEGLARSTATRLRIIGNTALAFADKDVRIEALTDVADSTALTYFVRPDDFTSALGIAHDIVIDTCR